MGTNGLGNLPRMLKGSLSAPVTPPIAEDAAKTRSPSSLTCNEPNERLAVRHDLVQVDELVVHMGLGDGSRAEYDSGDTFLPCKIGRFAGCWKSTGTRSSPCGGDGLS